MRSSADLSSAASTERSNLTLPSNTDTGDADLPSDCFLVERVVSARRHKVVMIMPCTSSTKFMQGKREYLILWEGYSKEEASWISAENVTLAAIQ